MTIASTERMHALINRLAARNRWVRAARLYGHWLDARRRDAGPDATTPAAMMWKYGRLLRQAGDDASAAAVYRDMAMALSHNPSGSLYFLQLSYDEWARCLEAVGMPELATKTRALGRRLVAKKSRERGEVFTALQPSRLLCPVTSRLTFGLSLEWEGSSESFDLVRENGLVTLRERFRFGDPPGPWLEFEAMAPAGPNPSYPHVTVCVKLPPRFIGAEALATALELVNRINQEKPACSCCLDTQTGRIALRGRIGFAGYNEAVDPLGDLATAQEEATLNMFVAVVSAAIDSCKRVVALHERTWNPDPASPPRLPITARPSV